MATGLLLEIRTSVLFLSLPLQGHILPVNNSPSSHESVGVFVTSLTQTFLDSLLDLLNSRIPSGGHLIGAYRYKRDHDTELNLRP